MALSFRGRLILFFVLIVALPMIAVAVLVSEVTGDSATGKADAALDADLDVALGLYGELSDDAASGREADCGRSVVPRGAHRAATGRRSTTP